MPKKKLYSLLSYLCIYLHIKKKKILILWKFTSISINTNNIWHRKPLSVKQVPTCHRHWAPSWGRGPHRGKHWLGWRGPLPHPHTTSSDNWWRPPHPWLCHSPPAVRADQTHLLHCSCSPGPLKWLTRLLLQLQYRGNLFITVKKYRLSNQKSYTVYVYLQHNFFCRVLSLSAVLYAENLTSFKSPVT